MIKQIRRQRWELPEPTEHDPRIDEFEDRIAALLVRGEHVGYLHVSFQHHWTEEGRFWRRRLTRQGEVCEWIVAGALVSSQGTSGTASGIADNLDDLLAGLEANKFAWQGDTFCLRWLTGAEESDVRRRYL